MPSNKNSIEPTEDNSTGENSTEIQFEYNNSLHDESYTNWMFNCDHLYELFAKTDQRDIADMNVVQRMERIKSFNSFLNEQIKNGKMKEIPFEYNERKSWKLNRDRLFKVFLHIHTNEIYDLHFFKQTQLFNIFLDEQIKKGNMIEKPIPKKKPLASLEWKTTKNGKKFNWEHIQNFKTGVPITDKELEEFGVNGFAKMPRQHDTVAPPKKLIHPYHPNTTAFSLYGYATGGLKKKKKTNKRRNKTNKRRNKRKQTKKRRRNT